MIVNQIRHVFWHSGFPLGLTLYGLTRHSGKFNLLLLGRPKSVALSVAVATMLLVSAISFLAFRGTSHLVVLI